MNKFADYWVDIYGVFISTRWDKKPSAKHRPLVYCDRPLAKEKLKELFEESGSNPLKFARLIEQSHGIREYEFEDR